MKQMPKLRNIEIGEWCTLGRPHLGWGGRRIAELTEQSLSSRQFEDWTEMPRWLSRPRKGQSHEPSAQDTLAFTFSVVAYALCESERCIEELSAVYFDQEGEEYHGIAVDELDESIVDILSSDNELRR